MKTQKIALLIIIVLATTICNGYSQKNISIAVINESISFPFTRFSPVHPGVEVGTNLFEIEKPNGFRQINGYVGALKHESISNSIYLKGEFLRRYQVSKSIGIDALAGLGYMHSFYPGPVYKQDSNGEFQKKKQFGRPHLIANVGIGAAYTAWNKFEPFTKYEFIIETPFGNGIPFLPHSMFKLGINYKF